MGYLVPTDEYSLTLERVREINYEILQKSPDPSETTLGGTVRDTGMLEILLDEIDEMADPFQKAATALQKIATRHPFVQGNKRTAVTVANMILIISGYEISINAEKLDRNVRKIARDECTIVQVYEWIKTNVVKINY